MDENWMMINEFLFMWMKSKWWWTNEWTSYIMDENWTMTNEFYSCEWKVNDVDYISYIMDENWIMKNKFYS
jgi:hypothetical protein